MAMLRTPTSPPIDMGALVSFRLYDWHFAAVHRLQVCYSKLPEYETIYGVGNKIPVNEVLRYVIQSCEECSDELLLKYDPNFLLNYDEGQAIRTGSPRLFRRQLNLLDRVKKLWGGELTRSECFRICLQVAYHKELPPMSEEDAVLWIAEFEQGKRRMVKGKGR